jgi:hypothetical protein
VSQEPTPYVVRARNLVPDADNKIHDDDVARQFGFSGALVPGVDLFGYVTHPLVEAWGETFLASGRLELRFRKPVYDGDAVEVVAVPAADAPDTWAVSLRGPDGDERATGTATPTDPSAMPDLSRFQRTALPDQPLPTGPGRLPLGAFGSIEEPVDDDAHAAYLEGIDESLPLYRDGAVVHPGALLRLVNAVLMRNVALGPWIHTASSCRFLGIARRPGVLRADTLVTEVFERNGNEWIRYDTLVHCNDKPVALVDHQAIYRLAGSR